MAPWRCIRISPTTWRIKKLVAGLEARCRDFKVKITDAKVNSVRQREDGGIAALGMDIGGDSEADLFVDASGFHAKLLNRELEEPFLDYSDALFSDRAVEGGWAREPGEPIEPYHTAESMDSGWCWRIDHEEITDRGGVFSSAHCTDEEAEAEYRRRADPRGEIPHGPQPPPVGV